MKKAFKLQKPKDQVFIWLSNLGLLVGLMMVVGLLSVIIVNGLKVFWQKNLYFVEYQSDFGTQNLLGEKSAVRVIDNKDFDVDEAARTEWQMYLGNKDIQGYSYKFFDHAKMMSVSKPWEAIKIERLEHGYLMGFPNTLQTSEGDTIVWKNGSFDRFLSHLRQEIKKASKIRNKIQTIEEKKIGKVNKKINKIKTKIIRLESQNEDHSAEIAELRASIQEKVTEYEQMAENATLLRKGLEKAKLTVLQPNTINTYTVEVGEVLNFLMPNDMSFLDRLGNFFYQIWIFVSTEPREANTEGGVFPAIFGTFVMTLLMSVAVMPFGVIAAVYLREYAKQGFLTRAVRIAVNNLAGVPSIVFGVFGLGFFVYGVGHFIDELFFWESLPSPTFGTGGILWASLTLALMTVPVVIVATEEALASVPRGMRDAAMASGASKWQTILRIVIPAAAPGIMTGLVLAMARGAGEVAPLMLVGVVKLAPSLPLDLSFPFIHMERKFMHLGFHIYDLGFQSPDSDAAKPMVFATTLLLITIVVLLNFGAIRFRNYIKKKYQASVF